jgi:GTP-binding protein
MQMLNESRERSLFVDYARIVVRGGRGGDGCMSFRREKYVPRGGPDGGNGGRGGDVFLVADVHKRSLLDLTYRPQFFAPDGQHGQGANKAGRSGDDLYVYVPAGTLARRVSARGALLQADLKVPGQTVLVAHGGRGGRGNAAFKTQRHTAPRLSEKGEPGEEFILELELKLLADVGLVGCPNAGKSTLLSRLTSARPKIADYPFTTLNPNLGVATWHGVQMVLADIPGLIEGAHAGKGLGHDFLRHIERTRLLFHVVDVMGFEGRDAAATVKTIQGELRRYSPILAKKPTVLVVNKMDLVGGVGAVAAATCAPLKALKKKYKKSRMFPISAVTGRGLTPLLAWAARLLAKPEPAPEGSPAAAPLHFVVERDYEVQRDGDQYLVKGNKVERLAAMTRFDQEEGLRRFQNILKKMGVEKELARQGVKPGDTVRIGDVEFSWEP